MTGAPSAPLADELESHRGYLLRFALMQLRDAALAEDAVQETLLAALDARAQYSGRSSLKTWLTGILKHKIVDLQRRQAREPAFSTLLRQETEDESGDFDALFDARGHWLAPDRPQGWSDPERAFEDRRFWEVLEACASLMPPAAARAFMLREIQGLETDQICKELNISATNCWVLLHRARMSLRLCLERKWFGREPQGNA